MKRSKESWIETGKLVAHGLAVPVAYIAIIVLVTYPVFDATRTLA
ncbi:MAG: hypothetical protein WEG36_03650 [Gemmatimonadota bacterium]